MNPARRPLVAGNWKMHHGGPSGVELAGSIVRAAAEMPHVDLVIAPPFTALAACAHECDGSTVQVAGQNLYPKSAGAFTGEVSAPMLVDAGCAWVIVGHSERRHHFGESDQFVAEKVAAALANKLRPIICVGETLSEREEGRTLAVIERQFRAFVDAIAASPVAVAIAYEPVWAIGTGKTATPEIAAEAHREIRKFAGRTFGTEAAANCRILYGGSVKPDTVKLLMAQEEIDGALVGGASLNAADFIAIARAARR